MTLYHGAHTQYQTHEGQCYTDSKERAAVYAGRMGEVATVDLSDALTVERCDGYDHDENSAPADDAAYRAAAAARGVDVLVYDDEDEHGWTLTCYRLVSEQAVQAVQVLCVG